jgi:hypothetical protein
MKSLCPPGTSLAARRLTAWAGACIFWAAMASPALAQLTPLEQRCWALSTDERTQFDRREPTSVHFSVLRDGFTVRSPFQVDFAVRGMGVAPAGVKLPGTGHHHILVNRALPMVVTDQLPFDDSHRHFGKGQTSTLIDLPPGRHTLRLLFADDEHRPYFVFSPQITVNVLGSRSATPRPRIDPAHFSVTCRQWYQDEVTQPRVAGEPLYFGNLRADERLASPFTVHMGVMGLGVCARGGNAPQSGHFVLEVLAAGASTPTERFVLANGATQTGIGLPNGDYRLRLRFVNDRGTELLPAHELPVKVVAQRF